MKVRKCRLFLFLFFGVLALQTVAVPLIVIVDNGKNIDTWSSSEKTSGIVDLEWDKYGVEVGKNSFYRIKIPFEKELFSPSHFDRFEKFIRNNKKVSFISLDYPEAYKDFALYQFVLKKITSLIKGINGNIRIGVEFSGIISEDQMSDIVKPIITGGLTPYFEALCLDFKYRKVIHMIKTRAPELRVWEVHNYRAYGNNSITIAEMLMRSRPFGKNGTTLMVFNLEGREYSGKAVESLIKYMNMHLIDSGDTISLGYPGGNTAEAPVYYKKDGLTAFIFFESSKEGSMEIPISKGLYRKGVLHNLLDNKRSTVKISSKMAWFTAEIDSAPYFIKLYPVKRKISENQHQVGVTGVYEPSVGEIIAGVRAHLLAQKRKLKSFTAQMKASYHLKISDLNETFDLMIKGPVYSERSKPYDWVQKEFFINGVKWKGKKAPKIPLLQPEKVNVIPLDIDLTENYIYSKEGKSTVDGKEAWIISFKPVAGKEEDSVYKGRLWIQKETYICLKKHLVQLNLNKGVLASSETQYMKPVKGVWLPITVKGYQSFLTGGRITNIEKKIVLENLLVNPVNFQAQKREALKSDYRIVRDTDKGLRYLVKNSKSEEGRSVEWKSGKSQTSAVFGSFYDSSFSFPVPLAGVNYLDFDFQGKGRQVNLLFGGALLSGIYSDPSFLGTKIDVGATVFAIALSSKNRIYRGGKESKGETIKDWPFRGQVNFGFPIGSNMKFSTFFFADYNKYSSHDDTDEGFIVPRSTFTYGARCKLNYFLRGFDFSLWGVWGRRDSWDFWGAPGNSEYSPDQKSFFRWRISLSKDFQFSNFRQFKVKATWLDGKDLDRFSSYRFGFFNELKMSGFNSGSLRAEKAFMLNLSYGYKLGKMVGLELKYDSLILTDPFAGYKDKYFSGVAIAGTTAVPLWDSMLVRFEAGIPVVSHGIKGFVVYFMLLKMF